VLKPKRGRDIWVEGQGCHRCPPSARFALRRAAVGDLGAHGTPSPRLHRFCYANNQVFPISTTSLQVGLPALPVVAHGRRAARHAAISHN
jgi:hypothetical protein